MLFSLFVNFGLISRKKIKYFRTQYEISPYLSNRFTTPSQLSIINLYNRSYSTFSFFSLISYRTKTQSHYKRQFLLPQSVPHRKRCREELWKYVGLPKSDCYFCQIGIYPRNLVKFQKLYFTEIRPVAVVFIYMDGRTDMTWQSE
jgi:hypothetical protein